MSIPSKRAFFYLSANKPRPEKKRGVHKHEEDPGAKVRDKRANNEGYTRGILGFSEVVMTPGRGVPRRWWPGMIASRIRWAGKNEKRNKQRTRTTRTCSVGSYDEKNPIKNVPKLNKGPYRPTECCAGRQPMRLVNDCIIGSRVEKNFEFQNRFDSRDKLIITAGYLLSKLNGNLWFYKLVFD